MTCVVVNDASCLIDLRKGRLLEVLCRLPCRFVVPLPVRESELLAFTPHEWIVLVRLRVMPVHDDAGCGVDAAPEAERLVERQHGAAGGAGDDGLRVQRLAHRSDHRCSSRTTRPATAERTHSARLPNATRDPRPPGA